MTERPPDEAVDAAVAQMLRAYEGPPSPTPLPRRRWRSPRRLLAMGAAGAFVVAAAALAAVLLGGSEAPTRPKAALDVPGACTGLVLAGRGYTPREAPAGALAGGALLPGRGQLQCGETQVSVPLVRLPGIDPALAVAYPGPPPRLLVAAGRCSAERDASLLTCLRKASATS